MTIYIYIYIYREKTRTLTIGRCASPRKGPRLYLRRERGGAGWATYVAKFRASYQQPTYGGRIGREQYTSTWV